MNLVKSKVTKDLIDLHEDVVLGTTFAMLGEISQLLGQRLSFIKEWIIETMT